MKLTKSKSKMFSQRNARSIFWIACVVTHMAVSHGTTEWGGSYTGEYCDYLGCGTVFELTPKPRGSWTEKILHSFSNSKDGNSPTGNLIFDTSGNLYGTTYYGPLQGYNGPCRDGTDLGCGTVFELTPKSSGGWMEKILHYFKSNGEDGYHPSAGFIFDASGNLYSSTIYGGSNDNGTVFELTRTAGGGWAEKVLYSFDYTDGFGPGALIFDASGDLYGTTENGGNGSCDFGNFGCGAVFEIKP